ncbi:MAG TPA: diacylglycerol kinase family protein [Nitriliruptorales bacterium]
MTSPFGPMRLIANPTAGRGREAVLPRLRSALDARGLEHDVAWTRRAGEATELARIAVSDDQLRYVVAVGGDGTIHEVVNGLVDPGSGQPVAQGLVLGAVPAGTGCDFVRTFGMDRRPEQLARHLDGDTLFPIDLGRIRLVGADGQPLTRLFANIAECGYGGVVTARANAMPKQLGKVRYLLAIFRALREFTRVQTEVVVDHARLDEIITNVVIANGQFFGGNMKVAPRAIPDDGRFNVQVWRGKPSDVFLKTNKIRLGEHLPDPDIREYQSASVYVEGREPLLIEADGEVLGVTPATFDVLPKVLSLKV